MPARVQKPKASEANGTTKKAAAKDAAPKAAPKAAAKAAPKAAPKATAPKTKTAAPKNAPKAAAAKKAANGTAASAPEPAASKKRKAAELVSAQEEQPEDEESNKKPRRATPPAKAPKAPIIPKAPARATRPRTLPPAINDIPSKRLEVFVFGEGSAGELGLGSAKYDGSKKPIDVKRPRINHNLDASKVGVVQISCGGMHVAALTHDNRVLTWGVNDDKALGRDTTWDGGLRDVDDEGSDSEDDDSGLNPNESTPGEVDLSVLEGDKVCQVAATDSATFILTQSGLVYGWGTFRGSDGVIGFRQDRKYQATPMHIPELKKIKKLATGGNHVVALDAAGKFFTWGSGGQFQLGRKVISRHGGRAAGLSPEPCGKLRGKKVAVDIAAGAYHSFVVDNTGGVWTWGLNNYSQTGLHEHSGEDDAMVLHPKTVDSLAEYRVKQVDGGEHHSVACTEDGKLLTWGRVDGHQVGHPKELFTEDNSVFDENNKPRILIQPTVIEGVEATFVATCVDHSFAVDKDGKTYAWGFSVNYQTGLGTTDDVETPTVINNSAVADKKIIWAGAGGQYSMLAAAVDGDGAKANGVNGN